ncbi:hypothetical protein P152DRAFT_485321 [Eremomyces bilateralis CBS 781.70]|uniref:CAP-Gly domain-containing protein n=1 Tax=Eremomyces bilateralis CBS 781.70 TaxID=1392243 RepID=A0A6G1FS06_9PEZI|nr:uncharacterized protein P152DRAFT_485321 [Eremomyces bilateralis CBS 781.70]KAF1808635.1 hypothetical protein P152DRAFT_485321 [Eremomyces bilateralis CBS 781.70]
MTYQTPRRLNGVRPSVGSHHLNNINTTSSPNLNLAASTTMARKASLNALVGHPTTPGSNGDIDVGDTVDVPGGMHGTVRFIGSVKGKQGTFAGVELSKEYASRGKNDGDVEGIRYFQTSVSNAGIFLPVHRATKRTSLPSDAFPPTPTTPSFGSFNLGSNGTANNTHSRSPPTPSVPKFSQSVGPGVRAPSPQFKPKNRPSLPRPESPLRKTPALHPPSSRAPSLGGSNLSRSQIGQPRPTASPGSRAVTPKARTPGPPRPYSRNNSRLGQYGAIDEDAETTPTAVKAARANTEEVGRLKKKLEERDFQLKEQAASLADMEATMIELQTLIPEAGGTTDLPHGEGTDVAQLRVMLREKNEKISMLTAEFDAHRADFRSTIDTLEMASTETERVYEKKVEELAHELHAIQMQKASNPTPPGDEDLATVAMQLKQLEELVAELEEGLEDARRGEAEARGEVEFLRGEVERGRSELKREREKAAKALKAASGGAVDGRGNRDSREIEQRDDEIRGLKAIIHSLSSGGDFATSPQADKHSRANGVSGIDPGEFEQMKKTVEHLERERGELQGLVERKATREEELERELERHRKYGSGSVGSTGAGSSTPRNSNAFASRDSITSANTVVHDTSASKDRDSRGTTSWRGRSASLTFRDRANSNPNTPRGQEPASKPLEPMPESDAASIDQSENTSAAGDAGTWCEICESAGHDILNCSAALGTTGSASAGASQTPVANTRPRDASPVDMTPAPLQSWKTASALRSSGSAPRAAAPAPEMEKSEREVSMPNPYDSSLVKGKNADAADPMKWCALCERDGHDVTDCPFEDVL